MTSRVNRLAVSSPMPTAIGPARGWDAVAGLPRAAVAAPGVSVGQSHVLVFGGGDATSFERRDEPETKPVGFRQDVLAYHTITDTWATVGTLPTGLASTTAVHWRDLIVIPGGETALGRSSARVGAGRLRPSVSGFGAWDYACLGAYLLSLVGMGIYFSRGEKTTEDFFVAGRSHSLVGRGRKYRRDTDQRDQLHGHSGEGICNGTGCTYGTR